MNKKIIIAVDGHDNNLADFNTKTFTLLKEAKQNKTVDEIAPRTWVIEKRHVLLIAKILLATEAKEPRTTIVDLETGEITDLYAKSQSALGTV